MSRQQVAPLCGDDTVKMERAAVVARRAREDPGLDTLRTRRITHVPERDIEGVATASDGGRELAVDQELLEPERLAGRERVDESGKSREVEHFAPVRQRLAYHGMNQAAPEAWRIQAEVQAGRRDLAIPQICGNCIAFSS